MKTIKPILKNVGGASAPASPMGARSLVLNVTFVWRIPTAAYIVNLHLSLASNYFQHNFVLFLSYYVRTEFIFQEIKKIPAFLNNTPTQEEIDASPALSALQALKYEETDPDGKFIKLNFLFKGHLFDMVM